MNNLLIPRKKASIFEYADAFYKFSQEVQNKSRYVHSEETSRFLEAISGFCSITEIPVNNSDTYYRCRLIKPNDIINHYHYKGRGIFGRVRTNALVPFPPEEIVPAPEHSTNGRVNCDGIPVLYLSSDAETAAAECRAYKGCFLSFGEFSFKQDLKIASFSYVSQNTIDKMKLNEEQKADFNVWNSICFAFSRPAEFKPNKNEYVPTQIISEKLKQSGFDGIKHPSSVGEGSNLVVFDPSKANCNRTYVREVSTVSVSLLPEAAVPSENSEIENKIEAGLLSSSDKSGY